MWLLKNGFSRDNLYNTNKTCVNWLSLPKKSLASCHETSALGFKVGKARVTALVCANVSGSHASDRKK